MGDAKGAAMRRIFRLTCVLAIFAACAGAEAAGAAAFFALPAFAQQWQAGEAITPNFWGPLATARGGQLEAYGGNTTGPICAPSQPCPAVVLTDTRTVQYFDKGRMELTNKGVTNGLLATEMISGQIQVGDTAFQPQAPPAIAIAGDATNPGPTYAMLATSAAQVLAPTPNRVRQFVELAVSPVGEVGGFSESRADPNGPKAITVFDDPTQHNVPRAFADYRAKAGIATIGYARSEPFSADVLVGGRRANVIVQVFERRVLTYTATNDPAFQVEMGNIGQHYYQWRYGSGGVGAGVAPTTVTTMGAPAGTP